MSKNENKFLEILKDVKNLNDEKYERFIKFLTRYAMCIGEFGEAYSNELKPFIKTKNIEKLEEITDKYITILNKAGKQTI